ncbi:MAG: ABC transporter related protein [Parcubacteria group bacterium LiPW_39]|nr:MAG: ABC transporter related protein [Parcubacteria group bacterium LiPW_39]
MSLIQVKNLGKVYCDEGVETPALAGVSFDIEDGEFVAVMGPSGSGKSTLLHILGFLDRPTSGECYFEGKKIDEFSDEQMAQIRNKKMGFIFQTFNLLRRASVIDNIKLPLVYAGIPEKKQEIMARQALQEVGLYERVFTHEPSQLSGGEQQRVAIARAIVNHPAVIFADEPTGNLDSKSGQVVMETLQKLHQQGNTIILVTHETYTAEYAKRIIRIKDGRIESDEMVKNQLDAKDGFLK